MLTRQKLVAIRAQTKSILNENNESDNIMKRLIDVYSDKNLMFFLKNKKHLRNVGSNEAKNIEKLSRFFHMKDNRVIFQRDLNLDQYFIIPREHERLNLILVAHDNGHHGITSTVNRIETSGYTWHCIQTDVETFIKKCTKCHKFNYQKKVHSPAKALSIQTIFDRIAIDLVLGLPETNTGYKGILVITEYLTKYPYAVPIRSK